MQESLTTFLFYFSFVTCGCHSFGNWDRISQNESCGDHKPRPECIRVKRLILFSVDVLNVNKQQRIVQNILQGYHMPGFIPDIFFLSVIVRVLDRKDFKSLSDADSLFLTLIKCWRINSYCYTSAKQSLYNSLLKKKKVHQLDGFPQLLVQERLKKDCWPADVIWR
jgi:hypothetical protein